MPTQIGIGYSQQTDTQTASSEAVLTAKKGLRSEPAHLVIIFNSIHHDPNQIIHEAYNAFPDAKVIGCSSAGIILPNAVLTHGVGILAISSDEIRFGIGSVTDIASSELRISGIELARNILNDFGTHGRNVCLFFVDGKIADCSPMLIGMQEVLGNVFPIVGAGSCDDFHNKMSFQICDAQALSKSACGLILGGQVSVGISGRHGWRPLGKPRVITRAEGNIVHTIDEKKASSLYEEYFDMSFQELRSAQQGQMAILYPLGIYLEESKQFLLRNVVDISEDGSIVCQGDVPRGSEVHIMIGNKDSCKQAAFEAAVEAHKNLLGKKAQLVIIIESMARLKLLGRNIGSEITRVKHVFGSDTPIFGMFSNGEICPYEALERLNKPYLQNESIVILAIS